MVGMSRSEAMTRELVIISDMVVPVLRCVLWGLRQRDGTRKNEW